MLLNGIVESLRSLCELDVETDGVCLTTSLSPSKVCPAIAPSPESTINPAKLELKLLEYFNTSSFTQASQASHQLTSAAVKEATALLLERLTSTTFPV
jgi:hypothetical protein